MVASNSRRPHCILGLSLLSSLFSLSFLFISLYLSIDLSKDFARVPSFLLPLTAAQSQDAQSLKQHGAGRLSYLSVSFFTHARSSHGHF